MNDCSINVLKRFPYPIIIADNTLKISNVNDASKSLFGRNPEGEDIYNCLYSFGISKESILFEKISSLEKGGIGREILRINKGARKFKIILDKYENNMIIIIEEITAVIDESTNRIKLIENALFSLRDTSSSLLQHIEIMKEMSSNDPKCTIEQKNIVMNTWENGEYLRLLVDNLSFLSYLEQLKKNTNITMEEKDLSLLIKQLISSEEIFIYNKKLKVMNNIPEGIIIKIIPEFTFQAFRNILHNSIKYSSKKGKIIIEIEKLDEEYTLSFTDEGIGIPEEELPKITELFFKGNNFKNSKYLSSGIGLYLAHSIFDLSGWNMWIESYPSKGTRVNIAIKNA